MQLDAITMAKRVSDFDKTYIPFVIRPANDPDPGFLETMDQFSICKGIVRLYNLDVRAALLEAYRIGSCNITPEYAFSLVKNLPLINIERLIVAAHLMREPYVPVLVKPDGDWRWAAPPRRVKDSHRTATQG